MSRSGPVTIEGYSADELLLLPDDQLDALVFRADPLVFHIGSATILGAVRRSDTTLIIELAQIEGGGDGALLTLWSLAHRCAKRKSFGQVEWIVHAVDCAHPNMRLRRVLERKGFVVEDIAGYGRVYHLVTTIGT
jgi:hypothetical protein